MGQGRGEKRGGREGKGRARGGGKVRNEDEGD